MFRRLFTILSAISMAILILLLAQGTLMPGGYTSLKADNTGWRVINRNEGTWIDRTSNSSQARWLGGNGWCFDGFLGDPILIRRKPKSWDWTGFTHFHSALDDRTEIPRWPFVAMVIGLSAPLLSSLFNRKSNGDRVSSARCRSCGYDLRATPNRCPECGAEKLNTPASKRQNATPRITKKR